MKKWVMIAGLCSVVLAGCTTLEVIVGKVEKPTYDVISSNKNIQTRRYDPMIIAEVEVTGAREDAIGDGFRILADYIFGNNTVSQEIAMTAPVEQQSSQEIAMTAPVQQQATDGAWTVSFVMPSEYTMETLPKPNNEAVKLVQVPEKTYVVIQFVGRNTSENVTKHEEQLMAYVAENNIKTVGAPKYAFYNPPWTLPFLRRNEVMLAVE